MMAQPEQSLRVEPRVTGPNEAGLLVHRANAVVQHRIGHEIFLPFVGGKRFLERRSREFEQAKETASSIPHPHADNECSAGLGTLSQLPIETRRQIYDLLLFDTCTVHTKIRTSRELMFINQRTLIVDKYNNYHINPAGIFDFRVNNTDCRSQCCTSRSLRLQLTSSTLRNEYRDHFLASACFDLVSPDGLVSFLLSLATREELQLRRLRLRITELCDMLEPSVPDGYAKYLKWQWVCSQLPPNLTLVLIDAIFLETPMHWVKFQFPSYTVRKIQALNQVHMKLQCSLLTTEVICKEIKKRAPNAKFEMGLVDRAYSGFFHAVMAEYN